MAQDVHRPHLFRGPPGVRTLLTDPHAGVLCLVVRLNRGMAPLSSNACDPLSALGPPVDASFGPTRLAGPRANGVSSRE